MFTDNNQLKLNLNAVVDNLNLVNLVHNPSPIIIEKSQSNTSNNHLYGRNTTDKYPKSRHINNFEFIDEEKLTIYSYLVQRDLKTKEYLNKYELEQFEKPSEPVKTKEIQTKKTEIRIKPTPSSSTTSTNSFKSQESVPIPKSNQITNKNPVNKPLNDINELKKCCDDSIKTITNLEQQTLQYKNERLKIVFNDPQEEEKQKRILLEQIKYLLRSSYNLQNQINRIKIQFSKPAVKVTKTSMSPAARLTHTMRQVIKTINIFADLYPYRPDKDLSTEKLCNCFYKQLQLSIENFNQCLLLISNQSSDFTTSNLIIEKLNNLLLNCNHLFEESNEVIVKEVPTKLSAEKISTKIKPKLNVIRMPRTQKPKVFTKKKEKTNRTQTEYVQQLNSPSNNRIELSPVGKIEKPIFEKKIVKTARLFPNKESASGQARASRLNESVHNASSIESLAEQKSQRTNFSNDATKSLTSLYAPAFFHLTSPKLSKIGFNKAHKSPNRQYQSGHFDSNHSINKKNNFRSQSPMRQKSAEILLNDEELSRSLVDMRLRQEEELETLKANFENSKSFKKLQIQPNSEKEQILSRNISENLFTRLDNMKRESDSIRRKYEKLNYEETLMQKYSDNQVKRRPYEECYLENGAVVTKEYETQIDVNTLYRNTNKPRSEQLNRVLEYAKKFADYNDKTSVTVIGQSKFNDFELFESLSNDLFDEIVYDVVEELEDVNQELTSHLMNNELIETNENDYSV